MKNILKHFNAKKIQNSLKSTLTRKWLIILSLVLAVTGVSVLAHDDDCYRGDRLGGMMGHMFDDLDLTADQKDALKELQQKSWGKNRADGQQKSNRKSWGKNQSDGQQKSWGKNQSDGQQKSNRKSWGKNQSDGQQKSNRKSWGSGKKYSGNQDKRYGRGFGASWEQLLQQSDLSVDDVNKVVDEFYATTDTKVQDGLDYLAELHKILSAEQRSQLVSEFNAHWNKRWIMQNENQQDRMERISSRFARRLSLDENQTKLLSQTITEFDALKNSQVVTSFKDAVIDEMKNPAFSKQKLNSIWDESLKQFKADDDEVVTALVDFKNSLSAEQLATLKNKMDRGNKSRGRRW